jgi:murein hydrolase activator
VLSSSDAYCYIQFHATWTGFHRMSRFLPIFVFFPFFLPLFHSAQAQDTRAETEQRLMSLREQIALDQSRLSEAAEAEEATVANVESLTREIALREELARTYRQRLRELNQASDSLQTSLLLFQEQVNELKAEYRARAVHAYTYGRLHDLALILASESINQMLIRARYLQRFGEQRQRKLDQIAQVSSTLQVRQAELDSTQRETQELLREAEAEESNLVRLQRQRTQMISELRTHRAEIQRELQQKQAEQEQLQGLMQRLTASETERRRAEEAANPAAAAAFIEMSGSFLQNRGNLPWPSEGAIQEPFGDRVNPLYGTTTSNPGIVIATRPQAEVRAIFDGEVILVDVMPDYGTLVTVAHGEYQSVYANFSLLYVNKGDRVRAGQLIGRAGTGDEPKGAGIFFALFWGGTPVDPVPWLKSR